MPGKQVISDEALSRALGMYAGMVGQVLNNPRRWLGVDEEPPLNAGLPARLLDAVRDRALGDVTPSSPHWAEQPKSKRVDWWIRRIAVGAALDTSEPPSRMAALAQGAQPVVRTLWRLARNFLELQDLFDERPRGRLLPRMLAKLLVVGVAGGWLDERGAIHKAARQTQRLIA